MLRVCRWKSLVGVCLCLGKAGSCQLSKFISRELFPANYLFFAFLCFFQNEKNCFLVKFQVKLTKIYKNLYLLNWGLLSVLLSASKKVIQYGNLLRLNKNKNKHTLKAAQQNKHVKLILFLIKIFWFCFFFLITLRKIP